ncbi:hypothetical protein [Paenisporosarcina indica]|uniref:hypothetical protein n=1 Tax=Paenisporosarcina indica TaxID=650093 RepID=UPI000B106F22|nr:hypothetical protein [Paenisporosarcina indica]
MDNFDKKISTRVQNFLEENVEFRNDEKNEILEKIEHRNRNKRHFHPVYWTVLASTAIIVFILSLTFISDGKSNIQNSELAGSEFKNANPYLAEAEQIKITIQNEEEVNEGDHKYVIEVKNNSKYPLLESTMLLSHDINISNGLKGNPFKVSIDINKEISPGQVAVVESEVPSSIFDQSKVNVDGISIALKGYLNEVSDQSFIHISKSNSVVEATESKEPNRNESPLFEAGGYTMIGEEGHVGFIYDNEDDVSRFYPNKKQKYMWHFWGDENKFDGDLRVMGTHESGVEQILVYEGGLGGANNGADRHAPSNMSLPEGGMWKLDAYIGDSLFGTVFVKVHEVE